MAEVVQLLEGIAAANEAAAGMLDLAGLLEQEFAATDDPRLRLSLVLERIGSQRRQGQVIGRGA